ncbi:hypothetical protein K435DRAFT_86603 [Dendrothele bispora CBS 962.96]|uniref:Uncharacterized protein n=1 Tax=Dendrothele bispora (strain CBS 962.96) TaxID=1314807 RepID=A0A4S8M4U4_DENBC|nr:hypothetical protein K435DRAFT_86603 [Dendrothele bispora CBS 962.96]
MDCIQTFKRHYNRKPSLMYDHKDFGCDFFYTGGLSTKLDKQSDYESDEGYKQALKKRDSKGTGVLRENTGI